jgi:hypothetical protein
METRHERSVSSTASTVLKYIKEIRSLISTDDDLHTSVNGNITAAEKREILTILDDMEEAIKNYWDGSGLPPQDIKNVKWRIFLLSQFMDDMVNDMRPERLSKTHGDIGSDESAIKLGEFCERLDEQISRLKRLSSK